MKYSIRQPLNERAIVQAAEDLLQKAGYRISLQLRIRTWRPDIIGLRGDEVVIVEAKGHVGDIRKALAQTALYSTDATSAYLAIPAERIRGDVVEAARVLGIGLIGVDEKARIEVKARSSEPRASLLRRIREARNLSVHIGSEARPKSASPALARLMSHRRVLGVLLVRPGRRFTIRELSREAGTSYSTTWRIVRDLESLGAIVSERVGTSRVLSPNPQAPVVEELQNLAGLELSPHRLAAKEFAALLSRVPEVRRAVLFGSVARGEEEVKSDVDIAIVLRKKEQSVVDRIFDIAQSVQDRTRMKIVPLFVGESDLSSDNPLANSIKSGEVLVDRP